jgi:hypothetical protein
MRRVSKTPGAGGSSGRGAYLSGTPVSSGLSLAVFLVSLALLNGQVTVTRLLSYRFYYHFVFFVVSLAQLGLTAAGVWVYASSRREWYRREIAAWSLGLAALPVLILTIYGRLSPAPNLSLGKLVGPPAYLHLSVLAVMVVAFNLFGGMVLTILFTTFRQRIGRLYASDLVGAASGCLASVGVMSVAGPIRAFLISGFAATCAALLLTLVPGKGGRPGEKGWLWGGAVAVTAILGLAWLRPDLFDPYRPDAATSRQNRIIRTEWNHLARTDAVREGRYVIDGDASTDVLEAGWPDPAAPEYALVPPNPDVAIIGVGAGPELAVALFREAASVLAIDINPTIIRWSEEDDRRFNRGIFHHPAVTVRVGEGRHVLRSSAKGFDLIVMHAIDTYTASAQGAYSLSENFLYTSEAMSDFLSKLKPGGVVSIRRWLFWPPRENLRLFTTVYTALMGKGIGRPEDHIVVLAPTRNFRNPDRRTWGWLLFSDQAFAPPQLRKLDAFVGRRGWSYVYRPHQDLATPFSDFVKAEDKRTFYASYPYIVNPTWDSNPFFFQFAMPWTAWRPALRQAEAIYGDSAKILLLCLGTCTGLTFLLLGIPLIMRRADAAGNSQIPASIVYFGCLGIGFMAVELPTIQIMTLFLGHPTYALSVVLLGLLAAAGAGSSIMGGASPATGDRALLGIVAIAVASAFGLLPAVHAFIQTPDWVRFLMTSGYLVLAGIPLGMPFVAGVHLLRQDRPHGVAWAWAVNGACAVIGSCVLMIVMVYADSGASYLIAAACYAMAFLAKKQLARR